MAAWAAQRRATLPHRPSRARRRRTVTGIRPRTPPTRAPHAGATGTQPPMRHLLLITWAAQASLIPKDPAEGVTVIVARDQSDCPICIKPHRWWTAPECPLLWTPNENNVGRWKVVQDLNNTVGCHPKQIRAKDDTWPVCNMCYEDRCCALDEEKCCVFDRRLVLNISFLVFLVLMSCCWGCWKGEKEAARKARLLAAVSHSDA